MIARLSSKYCVWKVAMFKIYPKTGVRTTEFKTELSLAQATTTASEVKHWCQTYGISSTHQRCLVLRTFHLIRSDLSRAGIGPLTVLCSVLSLSHTKHIIKYH